MVQDRETYEKTPKDATGGVPEDRCVKETTTPSSEGKQEIEDDRADKLLKRES